MSLIRKTFVLVSIFGLTASALASENRVVVWEENGVDAALSAHIGNATDARAIAQAFGTERVVQDAKTGASLAIRCSLATACVVRYSAPNTQYRQTFDELVKDFSLSLPMAQDLSDVWSQPATAQRCPLSLSDCRAFYVRQIETADQRLLLRCAYRINAEGEAVGPYCSVRFGIRDLVE